MAVVTGDVLRIVVQFVWTDGNINQNVFNAQVTGGAGPWDEDDILDDADAWADNMYANFTTGVSDELDGSAIFIYKWDAVGQDWDEVGFQSWTWNPTNASDQLPRGTAGLINMRSEDPDVSGKKYIPGLCEGSLIDGLYDANVVIDLLAFGADWLTSFVGGTSGATWTPGVWSIVGLVFKAALDSISASNVPAYQRRRKRTVGI